jgi:hypothetical protein
LKICPYLDLQWSRKAIMSILAMLIRLPSTGGAKGPDTETGTAVQHKPGDLSGRATHTCEIAQRLSNLMPFGMHSKVHMP